MSEILEREDRRQFVLSQLAMLSGPTKKVGDSTFVRCPFHSEKTPSARIFHAPTTRVPGILKCYGCGVVKTWDEYASQLGLQPFSRGKPSASYYVPVEVEEEQEEQYTLESLPKGKFWRDLPTDLLIKVGCKWLTNEYGQRFIWLPVFVNGELRGYSKARLRKQEGLPSYLNSKGNWTAEFGFFPFDYSVKMADRHRRVVLVEGQRDALRLISHGIPALAIMGTTSWTERKARLLSMFGIKSVVLLLDGDPAGVEGTRRAFEMLNPHYDVRVVALWKYPGNPYPKWKKLSKAKRDATKHKLWDPGNMPERVIHQLKRKYFDE